MYVTRAHPQCRVGRTEMPRGQGGGQSPLQVCAEAGMGASRTGFKSYHRSTPPVLAHSRCSRNRCVCALCTKQCPLPTLNSAAHSCFRETGVLEKAWL